MFVRNELLSRLGKVADISVETVPVGGSETGGGIPSGGGGETVLGDARLSGVVVTLGDVLEGVGGSLVEHGVEETEGLLAGGGAVGVEEGDDSTEGGGGARGTIDLLEGGGGAEVGDTDEVGVSVGGNVGEGAVGLVEVLSRGQVGGGVVQVGVDSSILP